MKRSKNYYLRKSHRYLGLFIGIQFFLWNAGGIYFSWTNLDEIHGDFQRKPPPLLPADMKLASPDVAFSAVQKEQPMDSITSVKLINILQQPVYQIGFTSSGHQEHHQVALVDAHSGNLLPPLTQEQALAMATERFIGKPAVESVEYLSNTHDHHEYRNGPLPAWVVSFNHPTNTTVYVAAEQGTVQSFRNSKWRVFDFLWMLHTMDFEGRDDINNIILRGFSVLGMFTILTGFVLFYISSPTLRRYTRRKSKKR